MNRKTKTAIAAGVLFVATGATTGVAVAMGGDDIEGPITGDALKQASDTALEFTGGGKVTDTEVDDEESYYEVEVTLDNGDQVDVQLDKAFEVVDSKNEGSGDPADD
jgi:uncharacterized membrane protein YkoI